MLNYSFRPVDSSLIGQTDIDFYCWGKKAVRWKRLDSL